MELQFAKNIGSGVGLVKEFLEASSVSIRSLSGNVSLQGDSIAVGASSLGARIVTITGPQVATDSTVLLNGTINFTLLTAVGRTQSLVIKNISATLTATVVPFGAQNIDGAVNHALLPGEVITIMPFTGNWLIVGH